MKRFLAFTLLLVSSVALQAQATIVTATTIVGGDKVALGKGTITMLPTDPNGNPLNVNIGITGGLVLPKPAICLISAGAITTALKGGSCTVVDTSVTNPPHFCYRGTIKDTVTGWTAPVMPCVQPSGSTWSLDTYVPITAQTALVVTTTDADARALAIAAQSTAAAAQSTANAAAVDSAVVHKAGNETISGTKAFAQVNASGMAAAIANAIPFADVQTGSDCSAKITAALASLGTSPGMIQVSPACGTISSTLTLATPQQQITLLPGIYTVSSTVTLSGHDTAIRCAGVSAESPESAHGACILQAAAGSNMASVVAMSGFGTQLSNIVVDGNKSAVANAAEVGIAMTGIRSVLDHVSAIDAPSHGITMVGAAAAVIEDSWTLHNGGSGIWSNGTSDVFIRRSEFEQDCQSEINATSGGNTAWRITQSDIAGATCYSTLSGTDIPVQWWNGIDMSGSTGAWMISGTQFAEHFDGLNIISGIHSSYDAYLNTIVGNSVVGNSRYLTPWASGTTYAIGDTVASANDMCQSLTAGNLGNSPATSPTNWICAKQVTAWSSGNSYSVGQVASYAGTLWTSIANSSIGNAPTIAVQGTNYQTAAGLGYWVPSTLASANGFHIYGGGSNTVTGNNCFREGSSSNSCIRDEDRYIAGTFPYHNTPSTITGNASQTWSGQSYNYSYNDVWVANADNYGTLPTQNAPVLANGSGVSIQNASGVAQTVVSMDNSNVVHVVGDSTKQWVLLGGTAAAGQLDLLYSLGGGYIDAIPQGVQFLLQTSAAGFGSKFVALGSDSTSTTSIGFPTNVGATIPQPLTSTVGNCVNGLSGTTAAFSTVGCLTEPGVYDSGTLAANLSNTVITGMSSTPSTGWYELECYAVAINAATAGTLPLCGFYYADSDTNVLVINSVGTTKTTSAIGDNTLMAGPNVRAAYIKAGTSVSGYTLSYAAGSGTALQYIVHFRVVRVGG